MSTYDQIIACLEAGEHVVVNHKGSDTHMMLSPFKDLDGDYVNSDWWEDIEDCKNRIGYEGGYDNDLLKDQSSNWTIVETFFSPNPILPPGTKVRIREDAEKICSNWRLEWTTTCDQMVGKIGEIRDVFEGVYGIYNQNKSDWVCLPREAFTVFLGEDSPKDTWMKEGEKNGWFKDGKVVI